MNKLFTDIAPRMKDRNGGYTRILKLGFREGDAADVVLLELVDYNLDKVEEKKAEAKAKKDAKKADKKEPAKKEAKESK